MAESARVEQIRVGTPGDVEGCEDATKHFHETGHPIMTSAMPGDSWSWCYIDEISF